MSMDGKSIQQGTTINTLAYYADTDNYDIIVENNWINFNAYITGHDLHSYCNKLEDDIALKQFPLLAPDGSISGTTSKNNKAFAYFNNALEDMSIAKSLKYLEYPDKAQTAAIFCKYKGKSCKLISKDYQSGRAIIEAHDVTGPYTLDVAIVELDNENPKIGNSCTCGHDSLAPGNQGKHSNWCDKYFNHWD